MTAQRIYSILSVCVLAYRTAAEEMAPIPENREDNGEEQVGDPAPATDDGLEPATPSAMQQAVTYSIGVVIGLGIAFCVLYYMCRKPSDQASPSAAGATLPYAKLATDDIEKGRGLELSSRSSNSSRTSTDDEADHKNWDDWDEDAADECRGEFVQHSSHVGSSAPPVQRPHERIPIPAAPIRSNSSSSSIGKLSSRSVSPATKRRVSPKVSRHTKVSPPVGDDLFASIGISAAPTFQESAVPSPSGLLDASKNKSGSSPSVQKRVSDVVVEEEGTGASGWVDDDDDFDI